jgi:hypothetical protein
LQGFAIGLRRFQGDLEVAFSIHSAGADGIAVGILDGHGRIRLALTADGCTVCADGQTGRCGGGCCITRYHRSRWRFLARCILEDNLQGFAIGLRLAQVDLEVAVGAHSAGTQYITGGILDGDRGASLAFTANHRSRAIDRQTGRNTGCRDWRLMMATTTATTAQCRGGTADGEDAQAPQHPVRYRTVSSNGCYTQVVQGRDFGEVEARIRRGIVAEQQCSVGIFQDQLVSGAVGSHHKKVLNGDGFSRLQSDHQVLAGLLKRLNAFLSERQFYNAGSLEAGVTKGMFRRRPRCLVDNCYVFHLSPVFYMDTRISARANAHDGSFRRALNSFCVYRGLVRLTAINPRRFLHEIAGPHGCACNTLTPNEVAHPSHQNKPARA